MTTETAPKVAPIAAYSTDEQFYATRYRQGGRTVYLVALTPAEIINNILRPNPAAPNPGNRQIRLNHAQSFAKYYLEHENWVIPGLILRAPAIFDFATELDVLDNSAQFGVLSYPKRKQGDIQILDGQHRILGFHLALEMLETERQKALDHLNRARRTEDKGSKVIKDAERAIKEIEAKQDRFYAERVAVEVHITDDLNSYRQMFFDIADNALGISASVKARFDKRKVANRAFVLVAEHPLLLNRIDPENDRLGRTGPYLLSARHVIEIIRASNLGIEGRFGKAMEREMNEVEVANKTTTFFDILVRAFPQFQAIIDGLLTPDRLRQISILGSPLFLRILAGTYAELRDNHAWSEKQVEQFFEVLAKHVSVPVHENSIWWTQTPAETFNLGSTGPNGRRQDIVALSQRIWDWAVLGAEAYPAVYADPVPAPPAPVDEDEGIDFAPTHDTTLIEVEERQAIEEVAKQSKSRAKARSTAKK
jgi:hypothetical protein